MKNLSIFIFEYYFLNLVSLGKARSNITYSIIFFLDIINLKVVLEERLGLVNLIKTQILHIQELIEVVIVSKDKDLLFVVFQIIIQNLKSFNNS